jgi:hypothetical protein
MPYTVPPDTRATGQSGHVADHNNIADDLTTLISHVADGLTGASAAYRIAGGTVSGAPVSGTFLTTDVVPSADGNIYICTAGGSPGTWKAVGGALDSTASDFQPDGVAAAGSTGKAADAGHVHPEKAHQGLYLAHSGALAETFPRYLADSSSGTAATGIVYCAAIPLQKGVVVTNINFVTNSASEGTGTHGWFALLDSTLHVLAVSADQTGASFFTGSTLFTIAMGAAYTVATSGLFYLAQSVTASTMPNWTGFGGATSLTGLNATAGPVLYGTAGTQNAPPAVNAQLNSGTLTASTIAMMYGFVS